MFQSILYTQWRWSRLPLLPAAVIAFCLPLVSVQSAAGDPALIGPGRLWYSVAAWSIWFPALAAAAGLLLASTAWGADHRGQHVYALSLPLPRSRYVLLRFAAGLVLLGAIVMAFWIGSLVAAGLAAIPPGLRAYPHALALRFALAAAVAYALFFAISSGTTRTAAYLLALVGFVIALEVLIRAGGFEFSLAELLFDHLVNSPGPLQIFTGRWMLIDV